MAGFEEHIRSYVVEDLLTLVERDPAAKESVEDIFESHKTLKAVMYYRVANLLYYFKDLEYGYRITLARRISAEAKVETSIDIHPAAKIGREFVIDHGTGTVIGETCEIGERCYITQGVVLGAPGIADNPPGKRHPTVGKNVQIGAFARIYGPYTIGDNVFISPYCVITQDVPSDMEVIIVNQLQLHKSKSSDTHLTSQPEKVCIYGIVPEGNGRICIYGCNFKETSVSLIDKNSEEIEGLKISIISNDNSCIRAQLLPDSMNYEQKTIDELKEAQVKIISNNNLIIITKSIGLRHAIEGLKLKDGV